MSVTSKNTFDFAMQRANHFLTLYDILHNSRARGVRSDWLNKFKELMHWPSSESVVRIDGKGKNSILLLRECIEIDKESFDHEYVSELLRSSIVCSISALDRYLHDIVVDKCWTLLSKPEKDIPKALLKISLPVLVTKKALKRLQSDDSTRPGSIVKKEIQKALHYQFTFQKVQDIETAVLMVGVSKIWTKVSEEMGAGVTPKELKKRIQKVTKRRNQIVHESDIILKTSAREITQRKISSISAKNAVKIISDFVDALDRVLNS